MSDAGPDGSPTDRELLTAHLAGDPEAFGALFARHRDRLWAVALRTTGHPEDAADALQDALVSAFRRAGSYRGDAAVTTWLHRIVVNACLDRIRRAQVRRAEPLPEDLDTRRTTTVADQPAEAAEAADRHAAVLAALAQLPAEQRAALVLVDMEGYSVEETAHLLGVAPGTVKSRCSRGRARLLPLLESLRTARPGNPAGAPHVPSPDPTAPGSDPRAGGGEQP